MEELGSLFDDLDVRCNLVQDAFIMYKSKPDEERRMRLEYVLTSMHSIIDLIENKMREVV